MNPLPNWMVNQQVNDEVIPRPPEKLFIVVWVELDFVSEQVSWCSMQFKYFPLGSYLFLFGTAKDCTSLTETILGNIPFSGRVTSGWSDTDSGQCLQSRDKIFVLGMSSTCMNLWYLVRENCVLGLCLHQASLINLELNQKRRARHKWNKTYGRFYSGRWVWSILNCLLYFRCNWHIAEGSPVCCEM